jgi:CRISPR-associated endonuclease/helicase Cas3
VVLPFTNIIDQAVDVYRKSLVLPGEDAEKIVAAVHHKAEYRDPDSRHLTVLWDSPIVVTTAVQFFETLASSSTTGLRKLHSLAGAGVFIDESHAALPAKLWPLAWEWIKELTTEWGCHLVFGSGSLNRIWTIREIEEEPTIVPPLVASSTQVKADDAEQGRWQVRSCERALTLEELAGLVENLPGPRLIIVNTVQIAAALAELMAAQKGIGAVMHLSTALTPHDRAITLERIRTRLAYRTNVDWSLVATSCIEAGVDVSFRTGLRQRSSLASFLQTSGRVNRNGEYGSSDVWDFQLVAGGIVNTNPGLEDSARIFGDFLEAGRVAPQFCTAALRDEILQTRKTHLNVELDKAEGTQDFPMVQTLFRVIDAETRTVVVSKSLQERIERNDSVDWRELQRHSVQIYKNKVTSLSLREAQSHPGVFLWDLPYDDLLGYMAGMLPLLRGGLEGGFIL